MEDGKLSKEQIEFYYKTSRKYFDELAAQYKSSDIKFYNENFAPYYSNPFKNTSGKKALPVLVAGVLLAVAGLAVAFFFMNDRNETLKSTLAEERANSLQREQRNSMETKSKSTEKVVPYEPDIDTLGLSYLKNLKTDFEKGAYYYGRKDYDKAEDYLNKIGKKDEDYLAARDVLKKIEREKNDRSAKKKPLEKIN